MTALERLDALLGRAAPGPSTLLAPGPDPLHRLVSGLATAIEDQVGGHGSRSLRLHLRAAVLQHLATHALTADRAATERELVAVLGDLADHVKNL